jgi:hypothetical protein
MEINKSNSYSKTFYGLVTAGVVGALAGLYYVYSVFNEEEELPEEQAEQLEELKQEVKDSDGTFTADQAIQMMALTNKLGEEMLKKAKPGIDDKRRAAVNNPEEYERVCMEYFEAKENALQMANSIVVKNFGNVDMEEVGKLMQGLNPIEVEKKIFEYDKPTFTGITPDRQTTKDIFLFYGESLNREISEFYKTLGQISDPNQHEFMILKVLITKLRIEDELYLKYKLNEYQLKYLIYEYNLTEDPDIRRLSEQVNRFSDMMG